MTIFRNICKVAHMNILEEFYIYEISKRGAFK
jgi:hypothetical protein